MQNETISGYVREAAARAAVTTESEFRAHRLLTNAIASWTAQPKWTPMQLKAPDGRVLAQVEYVPEGFEPDADPQFPWLVIHFDADGRKSYDTYETLDDAKGAAVKRAQTGR